MQVQQFHNLVFIDCYNYSLENILSVVSLMQLCEQVSMYHLIFMSEDHVLEQHSIEYFLSNFALYNDQ